MKMLMFQTIQLLYFLPLRVGVFILKTKSFFYNGKTLNAWWNVNTINFDYQKANIRIMETVAQRLGIPVDKIITNLASYGNTSAASIPLALDEAVRSGQVKKGDIIACAGFGAGLSWGAAILRWG